MLPSMLATALRARVRWLLGWGGGVLAAILIWWGLAPSLPFENLPQWLELALLTDEGETGVLFTLILPFLVGIPLVYESARWVGETASRETIAFLLTLPVRRWVLFISGWGFHVLLLVLLLGVGSLGEWLGLVILRGDGGTGGILLTRWIGLGLLLLLSMQIGMLVALFAANTWIGLGGAVGVMAGTLLLYGWSLSVPLLTWLRFVLPWYYYLMIAWGGDGAQMGWWFMVGSNLLLIGGLAWVFTQGRVLEAPQYPKDKQLLTER
ncbi:MAG: hypothetical protein N3A60_11230 [Thermanaerothrix sp.]|nr:hypothetical protein [Thermanaerothrix sp.]